MSGGLPPLTKRRRRILIAVVVAGAAFAAAWIGAGAVLSPWLRGTVERAASRALGRDLRIAGAFDVSFSLAPRVDAGDVRLANAPWGSEPSMVRAGRVTLVVDLLSLWSGPVRLREVEVESAHLLLEADAAGRGNWVFASGPAVNGPEGPAKPPPVVLEHATIRQLHLAFRRGPEAAPVTLDVGVLEARLERATGMIDVRGDGRFGGAPWEVSGRVGTLERLSQRRDVDLALTARLGATMLEARGRVLGAPEIELNLDAPDVGATLETFGLRSPLTGPFHLRGRLAPAQDGVGADVEAAVGAVTAKVRGVLDARLSLDAFQATVEAAGPDASVVGAWAGLPYLPARPFDLSAQVRRAGGRLHLEGAKARVGRTSLAAAGVLGEPPRLVGTDLTVQVAGRDLSELSNLTRLRLPPGPFEAAGRLLRRAQGLAIEAAELRFRDGVLRASGTIGEPPGLPNLDLTVDASGPDLAAFSRVATVALPRAPFALRGRVARDGPALALDGVEGRLRDDTVSIAGRLTLARGLEGTELRVRVAGPDLAKLASLAGLRGVPAEPFDVKGQLRVVTDGYEVEGVDGSVGRVSVAAEGRLGARSGLGGTSLSCRVRGPALSDLAAWGLPERLPSDPFSVAGRLRIEDGVHHADGVVAEVGPDRASVDGVLGALPDLSRLDVAFEAAGPSLAGLGRFLAGAGGRAIERIPAAAYRVSGRARRVPSGHELRQVQGRAGDAEVRVEGTVGSGEGLQGTDLRIEVSGPDLAAVLGPARRGSPVPPAPFEVSAELAGSRSSFTARPFAARLGGSDLRGSLSVRLDGRPAVEAELRSGRLDVAGLLAGFAAGPAAEPATAAPAPAGPRRLISDRQLDLGWLRSVDATVRLEAAAVALPGVPLRDVVVAGTLRDGALRLDRAEGTGARGGRASAGFSLEPSASGYRLATRGHLRGAHLVTSSADPSSEKAPNLDLEFRLKGEGRSLHELAASLDGGAVVILGSGEVSNAYEHLTTSGLVPGLLDALNPFRKSSDHTDFECGVAVVVLTGGKAVAEPIAVRTDKLTVVGRGRVDLRTEAIDLVWTLKPRRGIGLSPGAIANPYVKLGGTLSAPALEMKPLEAAASTGAAVATLGLTVLLQGLYDRITAEKNVCADALVKAAGAVPREREGNAPADSAPSP